MNLSWQHSWRNQLKRILFTLSLLLFSGAIARGQATATASRLLDLQVGGTFTFSLPDYTPQDAIGFGAYTTLDFTRHYGVELGYHRIAISQHSPATETSFVYGVRYHGDYGIYRPYVKAGLGRGDFNFPSQTPPFVSVANLGYNLYFGGGGMDFAVSRRVNVRADIEYQSWFARPGLPNGLTPTLFSIGAAYHFNGGTPH